MDIRKVKKLIEMMEESDISEIEIKEGEDSVRITRGGAVVLLRAPFTAAAPAAQASPPVVPVSPEGTSISAGAHLVRAPMVGTCYRAPSPSSPPFVEIGDHVKEGDTLCIIESMKMMNHIKAEQSGRLEAILVNNEEPVEFDQLLFTLND